MCKQRTETNEHVLCECKHIACTGPRNKIADLITNLIREQGGNYDLRYIMHELYSVSEEGIGKNRRTNYEETNESAQVTNSPSHWRDAFEAGAPAAKTILELGYARAHELLMRLGSDMPLWSGVITIQHDYLLRWG
jgi:hypothetical protein